MSTTPEPPAAAVAADAHWAAKMQRMRERKPMRQFVRFLDDEAADNLQAAMLHYTEVCAVARQQLEADFPAASDEADGQRRREALELALQDRPDVQAADQVVKDAEAAQEAADVVWWVRALPGDAYEALVLAHPPNGEQEAAGLSYDVKTFAPALIAACSEEDVSEELVAELIAEVWNQGEGSLLFTTCVTVNQGARVQLGKG